MGKSFYTYKITATDSPKYYIGVKTINVSDASTAQCRNDGYWGSGGIKYQNWIAKHSHFLRKEILGIFALIEDAYVHEAVLVGELYRTDKDCLNSCAGGRRSNFTGLKNLATLEDRECATHGTTVHRGEACCKCTVQNAVRKQDCPVHGLTSFQGTSCNKCTAAQVYSQQDCPTHGLTTFVRDQCMKCINAARFTVQSCEVHGESKHRDQMCIKCLSVKNFSKGECAVHGAVTLRGEKCAKCIASSSVSTRDCATHGAVKHIGDQCYKCIRARADEARL